MSFLPYLSKTPDGIRLSVHIVPGSAKSSIVGMVGDETSGYFLKVKIAAIPEDGKANAALLKFLAKHYGVAPSDCTLLNGHNSRKKTVLIRGDHILSESF